MIQEITHAHLFCGAGGGALGFNAGQARVGSVWAQMRCLGGIDVDAAAIRDFERLTGAPGTVLDLFDREDYEAFHHRAPPPDWREAAPADLLRAYQGETPDILFTSAPCKGFSGLLSGAASASSKYVALNRLALRGVQLVLAAYQDDPVPLLLFENVPRIQTRGRALLDIIQSLLMAAGYAVAETTHDCGELGGLAQHRRRFLLVARHREKIPPFLYEPPRRRVRAIGEVLSGLPAPDAPSAGAMHRLPRLQWITWLRLAMIPAGKDWRALKDLAVVDGHLRDYALIPETSWQAATMGVRSWGESSGTVTGRACPSTGAFSVADPRVPALGDYGAYGVRHWQERSPTVTAQAAPGSGGYSIADPRPQQKHNNCFRVLSWKEASITVTGGTGPSAGGACVQDPRPLSNREGRGVYRVIPWDAASGVVIGASTTGAGAFAVQDPRPQTWLDGRAHFNGGGHYGVLAADQPAGAVVGCAVHDRGPFSVADPRLPAPEDHPDPPPVILALDGTWHRPLTTLELAALQGFPVELFYDAPLEGESHSAWRERIGNAVPPAAAQAVAGVMAETLLRARLRQSFALSATPIWVDRIRVNLSLQ